MYDIKLINENRFVKARAVFPDGRWFPPVPLGRQGRRRSAWKMKKRARQIVDQHLASIGETLLPGECRDCPRISAEERRLLGRSVLPYTCACGQAAMPSGLCLECEGARREAGRSRGSMKGATRRAAPEQKSERGDAR